MSGIHLRLHAAVIVASALAFAAGDLLAAETATPIVVQLERGGLSPAVRDLGPDSRPIISHKLTAEGAEADEMQIRNLFLDRSQPGATPDADAALVRSSLAPTRETPTLGAVQFDGLSSADNFSSYGGRVLPPDTNHDVGPNHIVETTNLLVRIYDKSGTPLVAPFRMSALFTSLGAPCSTHDDGDPVVLYDPLADRWLLTQFTYEYPSKNRFCIAVSQTADPTGAYYVYQLSSPITAFQDYPHFGVWPDGYYLTSHEFNTALTTYLGQGVFALERGKMLVGAPASAVYFDLGQVNLNIGGMLPSDLDGVLTPAPDSPNTFAYFTATEYGDPSDALRLFDLHVDWTTPANSTFTERGESALVVAAFSPISPYPGGILQMSVAPGTASCSNSLDSISDRLMYRLQYRRLCNGTEDLVVSHTVNANGVNSCSTSGSTYQAGVRVYQLSRTTGSGNPYSIKNQATYAPDSASRWMASAALDHEGNLAVAYSAASSSLAPAIRFTGRLAGDPANSLQAETTMVSGTGMQTSTSRRWGDYSMLAVDPVDECTFWYSQEYYTAASQATSSSGWLTRIGNFKFASCQPLIFCTDFEVGGLADWSNAAP